MPVAKKNPKAEHDEDSERILHSISDRWHGDLKAYLSDVARTRDAAVRVAHEHEENQTIHSLRKSSRR